VRRAVPTRLHSAAGGRRRVQIPHQKPERSSRESCGRDRIDPHLRRDVRVSRRSDNHFRCVRRRGYPRICAKQNRRCFPAACLAGRSGRHVHMASISLWPFLDSEMAVDSSRVFWAISLATGRLTHGWARLSHWRAFNSRAYATFSHRRNRLGWIRCPSFGRPRVDDRYTRAQPESASAALRTIMVVSCASLFIRLQCPYRNLLLRGR
jgi:hypothetical protein